MENQEFKRLRLQLGLSQASLGEEVGARANTIARWERGEAQIPKAVGKLVRLMAKTKAHALAVTATGAVARDPHHQVILDALNRRLDPEVFEACAVNLLGEEWPGMVPVPGGSDEGFDGAIASGSGESRPFPLVSTTGRDVKANLKSSLNRAIRSGWQPKRAIFATSRRITPKTRSGLFGIAEHRGVRLEQVYDQHWFANALYRDSGWCKRLLGVTGHPSALSLIPLSSRPILGDQVIGRDAELKALRDAAGDTLLLGGPGSGKTFLLRALALEGEALFLNGKNTDSIANAVREQQPPAIIVDDAHVDPALLLQLSNVRSQIDAEFRIIGVSWPADAGKVRAYLDAPQSRTIELKPIDRDTMVKILESVGIRGPNWLVRSIVTQAAGQPGLAVTLAHLCRRGDAPNVRDVVYGDALADQLVPALDSLVGFGALPLLAAFSLGGDAGCPKEAVADFLRKPLDDITIALARLGSAGVIRQAPDEAVSVWPKPLRWVLVRRGFFGGPGSLPNFQSLLRRVPSQDQGLLTLIAARARGAAVSTLEELLEHRNESSLWAEYAELGAAESRYVLEKHSESAVEIAEPALDHIPTQIIPCLLDEATRLPRRHHNDLDHPLHKVNAWIARRQHSDSNTAERRRILTSAANRWFDQREKNDATAACVALEALMIAFGPKWELGESDPGSGRTFTLRWGLLSISEIDSVTRLWRHSSDAVFDLAERSRSWSEIIGLIQTWLSEYDGPAEIPPDLAQCALEFVRLILADTAIATRHHPGLQHRLIGLEKHAQISLDLVLQLEFKVLYPEEDYSRSEEQEHEWERATVDLARRWANKNADKVAAEIAYIETEAQLAGLNWPRQTRRCAREIASLTADPLQWAKALIGVNAPGDIVEPFLSRAADLQSKSSEGTFRQCLHSKIYRWAAIDVLITTSTLPRPLVLEAIKLAPEFPRIVESACLQAEVPRGTLKLLLTSENLDLALVAAVSVWNSDRRGRTNPLTTEWRRAIVSSADIEEFPISSAYWLKKILQAHPDIASEWLAKLIDIDPSYLHYHTREVAEAAVAVLGKPDRLTLLTILKPTPGAGELVRELVGDDEDLYAQLLRNQTLARYHLAPLEDLPEKSWPAKVLQALDAGYQGDEIAAASFPSSWSWSGSESGMWSDWMQRFQSFINHQSPRVAEVAKTGLEMSQRRVERCWERERAEAI